MSPAHTHIHTQTCTHTPVHTHAYTSILNHIRKCAHPFSKHTYSIPCTTMPTMPRGTPFPSFKCYSHSFYFIFLQGNFQLLDHILRIYGRGADFVLLYLADFQSHSSRHPILPTCMYTHTSTLQRPPFMNTLGAIYCCYSWEALSVHTLL